MGGMRTTHYNNLNPIAVLIQPLVDLPSGPLFHYMLLIENGLAFHNIPIFGERIDTAARAIQGLQTKVLLRIPRKNQHAIKQRLVESINNPRPYHPTLNNCQHTITRIVSGTASSPVLQGFVAATICLISIGAQISPIQ